MKRPKILSASFVNTPLQGAIMYYKLLIIK